MNDGVHPWGWWCWRLGRGRPCQAVTFAAAERAFAGETEKGNFTCRSIHDLYQVDRAGNASFGARLVNSVCPQAAHVIPFTAVAVC